MAQLLSEFVSKAQADWASSSHTVQTWLLIITFAIFFIGLEYGMLHSPVASWLRSALKGNPDLSDAEAETAIPLVITRIVGFIHNSVQVPTAIWTITRASLQEDRLHASNPVSHVMLCCAAGFFFHDAVACFLRESPFYIVHGAICCIGYTTGALLQVLHFYGGLFLMWEISTPFVQLRWVLYKMGKADTLLYKVNGLAMFFTFFLARVVFGTLFCYQLVIDLYTEITKPPMTGTVLPPIACVTFGTIALSVCGLNYLWFSKMAITLYKIFTGHGWSDVSKERTE